MAPQPSIGQIKLPLSELQEQLRELEKHNQILEEEVCRLIMTYVVQAHRLTEAQVHSFSAVHLESMVEASLVIKCVSRLERERRLVCLGGRSSPYYWELPKNKQLGH